jgi:hypothetical protein
MIRDTLVGIIAQRLNNRTDLNEIIIAEMQMAQEMRMEQNGVFQPWFMVTEKSYEVTDVAEPRIPVPEDFVMEVEEQGFWYYSSITAKWIPLKKTSDEVGEVQQLSPGAPKSYSLVGDHFTIYPTPDAVYQIRFRYAAMQASLETNIENSWLKYASDLLLAEVGEVVAIQHMQNEKLAMGFRSAKSAAWERLHKMHESRAHTNRDYTRGEE